MQRAAVLDGSFGLTAHVSRTGVVSTGALFLFLCGWHWRVTGNLSLPASAMLALLVALYLVYGYLFAAVTVRLFRNTLGLPYQFLCGYFVFNSLLFILVLCSPFGMDINVALLGGFGVLAAVIVRTRAPQPQPEAAQSDVWAACAAIIVAGLGATIWCGDIQGPLQVQGGKVIFKVWPDVYIHVREISVFAQAHGLATIHDIKLAGGLAPLYHFASYLSAAAVHALGGASAMQVYASFQLPFGILLTGLAAYCLTGSLFGRWAGVAAAAAVVLLPDGFHQGFANRYLSYYFLSQVNLGMLYGIACAALAWLFVLDGSRRGNVRTVLLGYAFLVVCLFYKAHIFVANSYLLMMFPILFFKPLRTRWRIVTAIAATAAFVMVVAYSQTNPRVPVLRLDGSGISNYLVMLLRSYDSGFFRSFFTQFFLQEEHSRLLQLVYLIAMLLMSTFGLWVVVMLAGIIVARKKVALPLLCLSVLVVMNYLIMSIGLAGDSRGVGTFDELLNRPLVWAHFMVAAWSSALLYHAWIGTGLPQRRGGVGALLGCLVLAISGALHYAPYLQTVPGLAGIKDYGIVNSVPACLVDAAAYVRAHGANNELVQDSENDPRFELTALSERQLYVGAVGFGGANDEQLARLYDIQYFMHMADSAQVRQFAASRGIGWFLAHPDAALAWPQDVLQRHVFACGRYRLYRFPGAVQAVSNK